MSRIELKRREAIRSSTLGVAGEVAVSRIKAHDKHGDNSIEAIVGDDFGRWLPILGEEFGEVAHAMTYDAKGDTLAEVRAELIDVATVATAWVAAIDKIKAAE
jgi:NTP pyrophosphatase (non-canonical NTP hydrolase)